MSGALPKTLAALERFLPPKASLKHALAPLRSGTASRECSRGALAAERALCAGRPVHAPRASRPIARSFPSSASAISPPAAAARRRPQSPSPNCCKQHGERPCFLTRGYGGKIEGPHLVGETDSAAEDVGDEPLLLAALAPTVIAANRADGAKIIEASSGLDANVIVMDDGFQNPQLEKDLSLIAVDCGVGIGNGLVLPAGPLRAPLDEQMARADALIVIGEGDKAAPLVKAFEAGKPVLQGAHRAARRFPLARRAAGDRLCRHRQAGEILHDAAKHGARLMDTRSFPDHHRFSEKQAARAAERGEEQNAHAGHHREGLGAAARGSTRARSASSNSARGRCLSRFDSRMQSAVEALLAAKRSKSEKTKQAVGWVSL